MNEVELPGRVVKTGKTFLVVNADGINKITINDVIKYYRFEANSMSGCRSLGRIVGDWRPIDELANFCLEYFKEINVTELRRLGRKFGLEPKF